MTQSSKQLPSHLECGFLMSYTRRRIDETSMLSCGIHLTILSQNTIMVVTQPFTSKCHTCHQLFAEFLSSKESKSMVPNVNKFVNVNLSDKAMSVVTIR